MHATRKKVVWSSDLMPGERVPVYTVDLNAPLLLLIHVGYCRTPVGQGVSLLWFLDSMMCSQHMLITLYIFLSIFFYQALVHHGLVSRNTDYAFEENTTTVLSADKEKEERIELRSGQLPDGDKIGRSTVKNRKLFEEKSNGGNRNDGDQPFHLVFSIDDITTETTVVDHLGQTLNLSIENNLGGGGQRHITIYCPYWIVNTTEHALRYRQEKSSLYVSGTVINEAQDGSRFVDLRDINLNQSANLETIFPGKPGALGRDDLSVGEFAHLMEKEIPLNQLASMAFMFNFRDVLTIGGFERKLSIQLANPD